MLSTDGSELVTAPASTPDPVSELDFATVVGSMLSSMAAVQPFVAAPNVPDAVVSNASLRHWTSRKTVESYSSVHDVRGVVCSWNAFMKNAIGRSAESDAAGRVAECVVVAVGD